MYETSGIDFLDPRFNGFLLVVGGHSATKTTIRKRLDFSSQAFYSIGGGRFPFRLAIPLSGQLLWGSRGTPHNEFPTVKEVKDLCPQRLQIFELSVN